jgi:3-isopropylmalate/(R)-2-methylmalate dehydratase large subunit
VIEYRGEAVRSLSMEGRMTVCNMSIEGGARAGPHSPDETTFEYLKDKPYAPKGEDWEPGRRGVEEAQDRRRRRVRQGGRDPGRGPRPYVSWGTTPAQTVSLDGAVPEPTNDGHERALKYMDLTPGPRSGR